MPLQREKTALNRGALDNLYLHNNPRVPRMGYCPQGVVSQFEISAVFL